MIHGMLGWENTHIISLGKEPAKVVALLYFGFIGNMKCWWDSKGTKYQD
jgi:hypothetical protein